MFLQASSLRRGFTLVELLVVIAIIGILIALLLPAVQAAREAARRTQCTNQLKQMGLAMHNHHDTNKRFPTGGRWPWDTTNAYGDNPAAASPDGGIGPGWAFQILPFMEQQPLYQLGKTNWAQLKATPVATYFCPSRRRPTMYQNANYLMDYAGATPSDSVNSWDQFWYGNIWGVPQANYKGIIVRSGFDRQTTFASILDGSSNTIAVGEKMLRPSAYGSGDWDDDSGWSDGWDPDIMRYTGFRPFPDAESAPDGLDRGLHFGSAHPGGLNVLLGDGSVRFLSFTIDPVVFNNLGDRRDGNPIPSF